MGAKETKEIKSATTGIPKIDRHEFDLKNKELLGQGSFGSVFKVKHKRSGEFVAMKISNPLMTRDEERVSREIAIMSKLSHSNLIKIKGYDVDLVKANNEEYKIYYLIMDLFQSDLKRFLETNPKFYEDPANVKSFMKDMLEVGSYLSSQRTVHRDIKPSNILLLSGRWVLANTDCMKEITEDSLDHSLIVSQGYDAPEILEVNEEPLNWFKCDVYAMGIVFLEVCGEKSFAGKRFSSKSKSVETFEKAILEISKRLPQITELQSILNSMLHMDPKERLDFSELKNAI
jgi:serine/threonine protein kinase